MSEQTTGIDYRNLPRKPWSPERRKKMEALIAKRQKAQGKKKETPNEKARREARNAKDRRNKAKRRAEKRAALLAVAATNGAKTRTRAGDDPEKKKEWQRRYRAKKKAQKLAAAEGLSLESESPNARRLRLQREYQRAWNAKRTALAKKAMEETDKPARKNGHSNDAVVPWVPGKGSVAIPDVLQQYAPPRSHATTSPLVERAIRLIEVGVALITEELRHKR